MTESLATSVRVATDRDRPFILDAWVRSHLKSRYARDVGKGTYHARHPSRIEMLLRTGVALVATLADDEEQLLGFVVGQVPDVAHYVYVKLAYRRVGIGSALLEALRDELGALRVVSHETYGGREWLARRGLQFDQYSIGLGG